MGRKCLMQYDICYDNGNYELCFYQDMSAYQGIKKIEEISKFVNRTKKYKELIGNQVILDILSDFNIVVDNSTYVSINRALNDLFTNEHRKIEIVPMKAPKGCEVYATTELGHDIYLTSDNYIVFGEYIKVWRECTKLEMKR